MPFPVDPSRFITFLGILIAMSAAPGPANIFCMATGMQKGKGAALWGVAGLNVGNLVWFMMAALGLDALVKTYPVFFSYLTYVGAIYIVYLGVMSLRETFAKELKPIAKLKIGRRTPFADGFIVQMTNPKAVLFYTALLPPFIDVARPIAPQLVVCAIATIGADIVAMTGYGLGGASLNRRAEDPRFRRGFALASGVLLLTAAALIVVET